MEQQSQAQTPVLIYDGECGFCAWWIRYWQRLTGDAVTYEPYQRAAGRYAKISREEFRRSIQLFTPAGERYQGAAAAVRVLEIGGKPGARFCYRYLPGCAWLAERGYEFIARHRTGAARAARLLWGRERYPAEYRLVSGLFLRLLGLIYLAAFVSFGLQVEGLIGSEGILPLQDELQSMTRQYGTDAWWLFPSVFWLNASNAALLITCLAGAVGALLLALNIRTRLMLPLLFFLYLSLVYAGQVFMSFQWDFLLLEV
ncbi:MAG: DCC1-like thiol-disulfide oxidoreductase family protein, partial [Gammaproteobacteria bacterium]